ncbi:MAG: DUF5667 domain-containing protein [Candidatus Zambryskibacteria bacterium]|nr:DUF5667 domain-containing protein [Candidatus Zambryskibacteria bacterium]
MKNSNKKIEDLLDKRHIRGLTSSEKDIVWQRIVSTIEKPVPSPWYLPTNIKFKPMIPLMIATVMFLGVGGTAAMADNSRPGDLLFGIDRATEEVRIAFAGKVRAADLKAKFAEERLSEVQALVTDARLKASASTTRSTSSGQAATTTATTTLSRKDQQVGAGVNVALSYLSKISADLEASGNLEAQARIQTVIEKLETLVNTDGVKATVKNNEDFKLRLKREIGGDKIEINTNGNKSRIEVREEDNRIRIELKDNGLINIKSKIESDSDEEDEDDENEDKDEDDDSEEENDGRGRGLEIRANIFQ